MTENTTSITLTSGRELLPAGVYTWHIRLSWPTSTSETADGRIGGALVGPSVLDLRGQLMLEAPVPCSMVAQQLLMAAYATDSVPQTATATECTLTPAGGAV